MFLFYRGRIEALVCPGKTLDNAYVVGPACVSRVYSCQQVRNENLMADMDHGLLPFVANFINTEKSSK